MVCLTYSKLSESYIPFHCSSSDAQDVVPKKQKDEQAIFTPDSSTTVNSLSYVHNSSYQVS